MARGTSRSRRRGTVGPEDRQSPSPDPLPTPETPPLTGPEGRYWCPRCERGIPSRQGARTGSGRRRGKGHTQWEPGAGEGHWRRGGSRRSESSPRRGDEPRVDGPASDPAPAVPLGHCQPLPATREGSPSSASAAGVAGGVRGEWASRRSPRGRSSTCVGRNFVSDRPPRPCGLFSTFRARVRGARCRTRGSTVRAWSRGSLRYRRPPPRAPPRS